MPRLALLSLALLCSCMVAACAQGGFPDAGAPPMDAPQQHDAGRDAGGRDAGRDAGVRRDAGRDAGLDASLDGGGGIADAAMDAGPPDGGPDAGTTCAPTFSSLAIVEVMVASRSGSGDQGEWFEVENVGTCTIALAGLVIESPSFGVSRSHTVSGGFIAPGDHFVFGQSADPTANRGLAFDYAYGNGTSGVVLNNGNDVLTLRFGDVEIDRVAWTSTDYRIGSSRQLSSDAAPASNANLATTAWCDATDIYSSAEGGPYRGTPGAPNGACP